MGKKSGEITALLLYTFWPLAFLSSAPLLIEHLECCMGQQWGLSLQKLAAGGVDSWF